VTTDRVELYRRLPLTADADWWAKLAAHSPDGRVLYVGCGTGRLALRVAREVTELVGVDVDADMLAAFRERLLDDPTLSRRIRLVEGRAEELSLGERFGLVILPSSLLNGMPGPSARTAAVRQAARHCHPDGAVVLQVLNPYWMACEDPGARGRLEPEDGGAAVDVTIENLGFDAWEQRQRARIVYRFADGARLVDELDAVALYPRELRALAHQAGLEIVDTWGPEPGASELGLGGGTWHLVCRLRRT
jgi:SAM-dependent methyltransferase